MNILNKIVITFFSLGLFFTGVPVLAAELRVDTTTAETTTNEEVLVDIIFHGEESVNAIEGSLFFPKELLSVVEIRDGTSGVNFWIEKPHETTPGTIIFSGITPGGFMGANQHIFSVVFQAKGVGVAELSLDDVQALKNDGHGTPVDLSTHNTTISIKEGDNNVHTEVLFDTEAPEDFKATIESDPNIFDGKYFLVFATQDKLSGIDHYEVKEGVYGRFHTAVNPYVLKYQSLNKKIFVKAIDRKGNERIVIMSAQKDVPLYQPYIFFAILFVGIALMGLLLKKLCLKYIK